MKLFLTCLENQVVSGLGDQIIFYDILTISIVSVVSDEIICIFHVNQRNQSSHRSNHQRCFIRKGVLRNFTKFLGKHLFQSVFFNKVAALKPATLSKKRLWHRCFPKNFVKFLGISFLQNNSERLLL